MGKKLSYQLMSKMFKGPKISALTRKLGALFSFKHTCFLCLSARDLFLFIWVFFQINFNCWNWDIWVHLSRIIKSLQGYGCLLSWVEDVIMTFIMLICVGCQFYTLRGPLFADDIISPVSSGHQISSMNSTPLIVILGFLPGINIDFVMCEDQEQRRKSH